MGIYKVFHKDMATFSELRSTGAVDFPRGFTEVATVRATSLDDVFRKTNHIDFSWWENFGIISYLHGSRSTSVGDVIVDEAGRRHAVANFGFTTF